MESTSKTLPNFGCYAYNLSGGIAGEYSDIGQSLTDDLQFIFDAQRDLYFSEHIHLHESIPVTVYRYYDDDGALLYVGIADDFSRRNYQHLRQSRWYALAKFVRLEIFPWRSTALGIESCAIYHENPEFNADRKLPSKFVALREKRLYRKSRNVVKGHGNWLRLPK